MTPGPWYEAKTGNHQGLVISEATGANVAVAYDKKDAPLIAAAPDMLAALETIAKSERLETGTFVCDFDTLQSVARAAVAKAKGSA